LVLNRRHIRSLAALHGSSGQSTAGSTGKDAAYVVYAALVGNLLVAATKFVAAAFSGSSAMLTEAIHSTADSANQIFLMIGNKRSQSPPDATHAFGYGMEIYFWTSMVAILVLLAGGAFSIFEGWRHLQHPRLNSSPVLSLGVLAAAAVFEGASFLVGYRASRRMVRRHPIPGREVGLWKFIKLSKDPNLYESLLEDGAALVGLACAGVGIILSAYWKLLWADGVASLAIGLILVADAYIILYATRSLTAGETVAPPLLNDIKNAILDDFADLWVARIDTLHVGPNSVMVVLKLDSSPETTVHEIAGRMDQLRDRLKTVDDRIRLVFANLTLDRSGRVSD
jgi:cation diffusion facilitator family transporter